MSDAVYGFKLLIFWGSFLLVPFLAFLLWRLVRGGWTWRAVSAVLLVPTVLLVYARFVEPHRLVVAEHTIKMCGNGLPGTLRTAVISDIHRGLFSNTPSMSRIVSTINGTGADLLLMPGDFVYDLAPERLASTFAPLADLRMPAVAVYGNHDVGIPGRDYGTAIGDALAQNGVTLLDPGETIIRADGQFVRIVGLRDWWQVRDHHLPLGKAPPRDGLPTIVLEHHPQVVFREKRVGPYDLFVSGHTHGGQILIPGVTCRLTKACETLRYGMAETPQGRMFVTSGVGMVGLPLRFGVPPRVDVLDLQISRCRGERNAIAAALPHDGS